MSDAERLDGRSAIVTGAGRGIGEAIAVELAARGARVLLADVDGDAAAAAASRIREAGAAAEGATLDVGDWAAFEELVADFTARAGRLDVLVNNAARSVARSFWEIEPDEWDEVMAVNLRGVFAGCRAAGAVMREAGRGRIVNLTSLAGQQGGINGGAHYAASKAGIIVLTKIVAAELAGSGVTVNAVAPAVIEGPIFDTLPAARREAIAAQVPVGRAGRPEEVAATVAFLASDRAAFITGTTIDVNGGLHMR
ncbi:MAG TPA: SDR family NAD(P)-dependent oxidoreductase [Solirubrobacterales bacterium]|nr:SDR family NAD(P)-dependent oxidoreductase [Solirubrobacterales bacterium]